MAWQTVQQFFHTLTPLDYTVLVSNALLMIFAHPLLKRFSSASVPDKTHNLRVYMLRGLNLTILLVYGYIHFYKPSNGASGSIKVLSILAIIYLANIANYLLQYMIHKHYGKAREIGERTVYVETYQSRLLSILTIIFVTIIAIVGIVQVLDFDSMLEAGGVIGIIGVFLGLTQSAWAPDIISGLIILNSDLLEEGDIIETGDGVVGRVYKTKLFHTEILNIGNNHRIMMRNAHLRDKTIHNLSKFASAKGLRECLSFNIGYEVEEEHVKAMFEEAFKIALTNGVPLEENTGIEIKVLDTGDHAVNWGLFYYIKKVDKILNARRDFREIVLRCSKAHQISLATPFTHHGV